MLKDKKLANNSRGTIFENKSTVLNGKYGPLQKWFLEQNKQTKIIHTSFNAIEKIIGQKLPYSARTYPAWWANGNNSHDHAQSWLYAGWQVESVDFDRESVTFRVF